MTPGKRPRLRYLREGLVLVAASAAAAVGLVAYHSQLFGSIELHTVDARFAIRGSRTPPADLVVVQIDDRTFNALGLRWPFPRSVHARLIRRISADRPSLLAYDVQFTEQTTAKEDNALINAIGGAHAKVVLAASAVDSKGRTNVLGGDAVLRRLGARVGSTAFPPDSDGVLRRVPFAIEGLKSFAVVSAETVLGRRIDRASMGAERQWVDFYGHAGTVRAVSFSSVVSGHVKPGFFSGKVVVVGASAGSLQDLHSTATSRSQLMSGPEIEANAISTALRAFPLRSAPKGTNVILIILCALLVPVANLRVRLTPAIGLGIAGALGLGIGAVIAFNAGWVVALTYPGTSLILSAVGVLGACHGAEVLKRRVAGPAVRAAEAGSTGKEALDAGDFERAVAHFGRSQRLWQEAGVPYEAARCRILLGEAFRELGDIESATMQVRAAQQAFGQLGAVSDEREAFEALQNLGGSDSATSGAELAIRTLMITDIVDSTSLISVIGDEAWAHLHRWHDDTLRALLAQHRGEEVNHTGDGFFVAFTHADDALRCAIDIQRTFVDHRRTHGFSPRVRIGIHTCATIRATKGYEGIGIHAAARIAREARPDEILASLETLKEAKTELRASELQSLNAKGIASPIQVAVIEWGAVAGAT